MAGSYEFHEKTKYRRHELPGRPVPEVEIPRKRYDEGFPRFELARPEKLPATPFWEVVARRRSVREYRQEDLGEEDLFLLLWATQGVTQPGRLPFRATPSAGALYPLETYIAANRVSGLEAGLYYWELPEERLVRLYADGRIASRIAAACLDQSMCAEAQCVFVWTAVFARTRSKYGERGLRYIYMDAGHVGQNLQLAATALGLGSCNVGALFDDEVNELLGVDGLGESVLYATAVGKPAGG